MALYEQATLGTASNRVTFNDYTNTNILFRVKSRQPQKREIRALDVPIPFENGVTDFRSLIGKMAYVIDGTIYPADEEQSRLAIESLRKVASLEISQDDAGSDSGYVPYIYTDNTTSKQIFVKVMYVDIKETTTQGLIQNFRLICKIKDPTIHSSVLSTASTQGVDPTLSAGSATVSFVVPAVVGASTGSVQNTINNAGDLDAYPQSIKVVGPVNIPKITNGATGEYIEVSHNLATTSNSLIIVYDKDNLSVEVDGTSVLGEVTSGSTYFKLTPGDNAITLSGSSIGSGSYLLLTAYSAWPLS